jgi:hypothetical protein
MTGTFLLVWTLAAWVGAAPVEGQSHTRVVGVVRDAVNAIPLPGVPVEVAGTGETV